MPQPSWRRFVALAAFAAAVAGVVALNRRAAGSAAAWEAIRLSEVAHQSGIDFVHRAPTLDPQLAHIAAHVAALGACVSVTDVNNDNWPDLYFTTSRFGAANALYLNQRDGTFRDVAAEAGVASLNRAGRGGGCRWARCGATTTTTASRTSSSTSGGIRSCCTISATAGSRM